MKNFICCILFLFVAPISAQELSESHLDELKRNILAYKIRNYESFDYTSSYPTCEWTLVLEVSRIEANFENDNSEFIYFNVINDNFKLVNKMGNEEIKSIFIHNIPNYYKLSRKNLIALDKRNEIFYLGGNFFKSSIADRFTLSIDKVNSFFGFIKVKLYNYGLNNIKFIRKNKKYIIFRAYSNVLLKDVKIKVNKDNFDNILVE